MNVRCPRRLMWSKPHFLTARTSDEHIFETFFATAYPPRDAGLQDHALALGGVSSARGEVLEVGDRD